MLFILPFRKKQKISIPPMKYSSIIPSKQKKNLHWQLTSLLIFSSLWVISIFLLWAKWHYFNTFMQCWLHCTVYTSMHFWVIKLSIVNSIFVTKTNQIEISCFLVLIKDKSIMTSSFFMKCQIHFMTSKVYQTNLPWIFEKKTLH